MSRLPTNACLVLNKLISKHRHRVTGCASAIEVPNAQQRMPLRILVADQHDKLTSMPHFARGANARSPVMLGECLGHRPISIIQLPECI